MSENRRKELEGRIGDALVAALEPITREASGGTLPIHTGSDVWQGIDAVMPIVDELLAELTVARLAHQAPYVDAEHQGGNCVDVIMHHMAESARLRRELDAIKP